MEVNKNQELSGMQVLSVAFAVASLCLMIIPIAQAYLLGGSYRAVMIVCMGGWVVTSILSNGELAVRRSAFAGMTTLLVLFYIILALGNFGNIRKLIVTVAAPYFSFYVFYIYDSGAQKKLLTVVLNIMLLAFAITMVTTLIGFSVSKYAYRESGGTAGSIHLYKRNIGATTHIYAAALLATLLGCYLKSRIILNAKYKAFLTAVMVLCMVAVLSCSSATPLLCMLIGLTLLLVQDMRGHTKILLVMSAFIVFLFGVPVLAAALDSLAGTIDNAYISKKLGDIALSLNTGGAQGELAARTDMWKADFDVFVQTNFVGIGPYYTKGGNGRFIITDHSQIIADLARYGFAFFVFMVAYILQYRKSIAMVVQENLQASPNLTAYYVVLLLMYFFQPILTNLVIPFFILYVALALPVAIGRSNSPFINHHGGRKQQL